VGTVPANAHARSSNLRPVVLMQNQTGAETLVDAISSKAMREVKLPAANLQTCFRSPVNSAAR